MSNYPLKSGYILIPEHAKVMLILLFIKPAHQKDLILKKDLRFLLNIKRTKHNKYSLILSIWKEVFEISYQSVVNIVKIRLTGKKGTIKKIHFRCDFCYLLRIFRKGA